MSGTNDLLEEEGAADIHCCACCGIAEVDDVELKKCDDCDLVRYCSDKCQQDHRPEHEAKCKERAAELRDEILFRQPEGTHLGDCPICCLPLNPMPTEFTLMACCSKFVCIGCEIANGVREWQSKISHACPFCRQPIPTDSEAEVNNIERAAANDPVAIREMGASHFHKEDWDAAMECYSRAASLGDADANYKIGSHYCEGTYVEKDEEKGLYHLEEAAIAGHPDARYELAHYELFQYDDVGMRADRAVKHLIIAAKLGNDKAIQTLRHCYTTEFISKEVYAASLRDYQAAVVAMKSPNRETAAASKLYAKQHSSEEIMGELLKKFSRQEAQQLLPFPIP